MVHAHRLSAPGLRWSCTLVAFPSSASAQGVDYRCCQGCVWRGVAGRDRRSRQPRSDREGPHRYHRRRRSLPHPRLRSGTYSVTFTLPGFSPPSRRGGAGRHVVATIDAELKVGALQETDRHRRIADRRCRASAARPRSQRCDHGDTGDAIVQQPEQLMPNTVTQGGAAPNSQTAPTWWSSAPPAAVSTKAGSRWTASASAPRSTAPASPPTSWSRNAREIVLDAAGAWVKRKTAGPRSTLFRVRAAAGFRRAADVLGVTQGMVGSNYTQGLRTAG